MYNNFIKRLTIQREILIYLYELFKIIFTMLHKSIDL